MVYRPRERVWTPATFEVPPSFDAVKAHLQITHDKQDLMIIEITAAATMAVEKFTQRLLSLRQVVLKLPGLPAAREAVELPGGKIDSVTSVVADGTPVTGFQVVGDSPARLIPNADWPGVSGDPEGYPVTITYQAGYRAIPYDLLAAMKMIAGELYERRSQGDVVDVKTVPVPAEYMMGPYRIRPI